MTYLVQMRKLNGQLIGDTGRKTWNWFTVYSSNNGLDALQCLREYVRGKQPGVEYHLTCVEERKPT